MLTLKALHKSYGRSPVLEAVSLSLPPASLNVMIGPNGAGKSTLLRIIAQLERPSAGRVEFDGKRLRPEQVGYLPQAVLFHPLLTVGHIIRFYAEVWGVPGAAAQAAVVRWGLEEHTRKKTAHLSGGLRQRLGIAILSLRSYDLLLLDEPSLSLDPKWRRALQEWLASVARQGSTVIVTTHLAAEWDGTADRTLLCEDRSVRVVTGRAEHTAWREVPGGGMQ